VAAALRLRDIVKRTIFEGVVKQSIVKEEQSD
jgi:hypothetical protein